MDRSLAQSINSKIHRIEKQNSNDHNYGADFPSHLTWKQQYVNAESARTGAYWLTVDELDIIFDHQHLFDVINAVVKLPCRQGFYIINNPYMVDRNILLRRVYRHGGVADLVFTSFVQYLVLSDSICF